MRVFINCDVQLGGGTGGVEQFISGLLYGLGKLDSEHEFVLGVRPDAVEWLEPYLGNGMRPVPYGTAAPPGRQRSALERRVRQALSPYKRRVEALLGRGGPPPTFIDELEPDVVHFPWQKWLDTSRPVVLNIHDLQHLHFPQFFSDEELARRKQ